MYARVTQAQIRPDKMKEYRKATESLLPLMRKQNGFRALIILNTGDAKEPAVTSVTLWDSHESLKASETNLYLYQALSRLISFLKGFPAIREHEVMYSEFAVEALGSKEKESTSEETQW